MNSPPVSLSPLRAFVLNAVLRSYQPRATGSVWQWAEKNIYLDERQSPGHPGQYDSSLTPYTRSLQDFINDPDWDEFIIMKSSQVGVTEGVLNAIRYCVALKPTNILYSIDSADEARKINRTRLQPTISKLIPEGVDEVSEADMQTLTLYLAHMTIYMAGGHSGGALANKAIGLGIIDEADEHPAPAKGDIENVDKLRERLKTVPGKKLYLIGRPKTDKHVTYREYLTGTQEKIFLPCPHCDHFQELDFFNGVRFDHCKDLLGAYDLQQVLKATYYRCAKCEGVILDGHKHEMNLRGEARATNLKHKPKKRSLHISDLYSPFVTFGELAIEFIEATQSGSLIKLQTFYNNRLGLPFKQQQAEVTENDVLACRGAYRRGTLPWSPCMIGMGVDKQGDVQKWVKGGFLPSGELAIIDYGMTLAEDELVEVADDPVPIPGEEDPMSVQMGFIDEGFQAKAVRKFVLGTDGLFFSSKGRGGVQVRHTVAESTTIYEGVEQIVYHFDDDGFKKDLYITRIAGRKKISDGKKKGQVTAPYIWFPVDIEQSFAAEMAAEKLVEVKESWGFTKLKWEKTGPNDYGDAVKQLLVMWHVVGPEFQEETPPPEEEKKEPVAAAA